MSNTLKPKVTQLSIREDQAAAAASSLHGSNLDVVGFNMTFLMRYDPVLAKEVIDLLHRAGEVEEKIPNTLRFLGARRR